MNLAVAEKCSKFSRSELIRRWPQTLIALSVLAWLIPGYLMLGQTIWSSDEQGHGPIILAVTIWLAWIRRAEFSALPDSPTDLAGWFSLALAFLMYVIGRSQSIDTLEVLSHIPLLASATLLTKGWRGLRWSVFLLFFLLFMVPLPGILVQTITTPLKISVSHVAEAILHQLNYPVARSGVILYVGNYQLLVADACAGLNSMFTLEALGLLYMNLMQYSSFKRKTAVTILIIPIAFSANVVRVITLVLVTFYFGDEAGQGFIHGFAGMLLFLVALVLMLATDGMLGRIFPEATSNKPVGQQ